MAKDKEKKEKKEKKKDDAPAEEAPAAAAAEEAPAAAAKPAAGPKKHVNYQAVFKQHQITEMKEAFTLIDGDRDGIIGADDLSGIYQQLGREADPKVIKEMLAECTEKLNFTQFLNMFAANMQGTDTEGTLRDAFILFDPEKSGKLHEEYFKDLMLNVGDQYSKDELKQVLKETPIEGGKLDYQKFVSLIKGRQEDE